MVTNTKVTFHKEDNLPSSDLEVGGIYFTQRPGAGNRYKINIATSANETVEVRSNDCAFYENVGASNWEEDTTHQSYFYKCVLTTTGSTSNMVATVFFDDLQVASGLYAPFCETGTDTVTIWSKVNSSITIPLIKVEGA